MRPLLSSSTTARLPLSKAARLHILVLAGYLLLTLVMTYPLAVHFTQAIPGDGFDGWQNSWNLWW